MPSIFLKADLTAPRFVVYLMANGPFCSPFYVCRNGALTEKDGEEVHPYRLQDGVICHHCTSKASYARAKALLQRIGATLPARRTLGRGSLRRTVSVRRRRPVFRFVKCVAAEIAKEKAARTAARGQA
jgi:hypothetical protein